MTTEARAARDVTLNNEFEVWKLLPRDYVDATIGFKALAEQMDEGPGKPARILRARLNPHAGNPLAMVSRLKRNEGVSFAMTPNS
ncbi:MAG: transcriptional regulator [Hyphomonadaceae bacterium]|nr:transcriptional regulator [Hyphomonadaceae bacterium]MBC6412373.1 transcriptional regulator [Hyphomonadaceae bacterium]